MLHQIAEANGGIPDRCVVSFQNTGREMPETLDFVQECSDRWGIPIVWLEWIRGKPKFQVVSHNSAARNGEPFEALIWQKKHLPNIRIRFCTQELKVLTSKRYLRSIGWDRWTNTVGIRADEGNRLGKPDKDRWVTWHPLADAGVTKRDVSDFWDAQPFDLRLPNVNGSCWLGNCDGCFLKSESTLAHLAREYPDRHKWWQDMEDLVSDWTLGPGRFRFEYSRRELKYMVENQGDWIFDTEGALCQADHGDCTG
jgi:3'-phosphoadenosine 5'-phosphosulfate sulfotransferase (PAPS reductase)/FAD synthetase